MRYLKALQALDLAESHRMVVMAGLASLAKQNDPVDLETLCAGISSSSGKPGGNFSQEALSDDTTFWHLKEVS